MTLLVEPETASTYLVPGQYVEVKVPKGSGYFVLAGEPRSAAWELLIRNAGEAADALASLPVGTPMEISRALGQGFPVDRASKGNVIVAAVGSALAAVRPILTRRLAEGDAARTVVLLGVRGTDDVPLADEVRAWSERFRVVLCVSRGAAAEPDRFPEAELREGYVQRELERMQRDGEVSAGTLLFAAGPEPMLGDLRELGGPDETALEVITNV